MHVLKHLRSDEAGRWDKALRMLIRDIELEGSDKESWQL